MSALAQQQSASLLEEISAIKMFDNHAHVVASSNDLDYDALRCELLTQSPVTAAGPLLTRSDIPELADAWRALYGLGYVNPNAQQIQQIRTAKERVKQDEGQHYAEWVLDKIGTEYIAANRVRMAPELRSPRILWVPYDDALLFPLGAPETENPDRKVFSGEEQKILRTYLQESGATEIPGTLDDYVNKIVAPTLERQKKAGAIAIKFEVAYLRSLDFEAASEKDAAEIYAKYHGAQPSGADYKTLEDYLFRAIAKQAGELGLAVHIHTGFGCGDYFQLAGSNPMLLESAVTDPQLQKTNFVLLHGGWPFTAQAASMMWHPNVYADFSLQVQFTSNRALSQVLRQWLEFMPEKVLYGSDASPSSPENNWEEPAWIGNHHARQALAWALEGMIQDGEITHGQALNIARMALRENAMKLYGVKE
jgi:predicted TIM-barrel fold metal-dependent hydrolase